MVEGCSFSVAGSMRGVASGVFGVQRSTALQVAGLCLYGFSAFDFEEVDFDLLFCSSRF